MFWLFFGSCTLPKTNIAPENRPSQEETIVFQPSIFRSENVGFREGRWFQRLALGPWTVQILRLFSSPFNRQISFLAPNREQKNPIHLKGEDLNIKGKKVEKTKFIITIVKKTTQKKTRKSARNPSLWDPSGSFWKSTHHLWKTFLQLSLPRLCRGPLGTWETCRKALEPVLDGGWTSLVTKKLDTF